MSDRMYSADRALPGVCDHVPYVLDAAAVDAVAAAVDSSGLRVRSINGDIGDLNHPLDAAARATGWGRVFLVLLASGVAISAWALFPTTVERGIYVPLPETSTPSAADVKSAREGVVGSPLKLSRANAFTLMDAKLVSSKPTMYGLVTARYPSPVVDVSLVPLRSKLQALLMLLYSQSGVLDPAALEAKLQALLTLPDSVLAQLMEHPDLADLNKMLDAVFLGTSDLSGVKTELDKIDVTSVPGPSEKIDVVKVNGKPAYIVHSPAVQNGPENAAGSPVSAPPPPGEPVTVTVVSQVEAPAACPRLLSRWRRAVNNCLRLRRRRPVRVCFHGGAEQ